MREWLKRHSLKLLAIRDTPNAIAGGIAIGFFFGFTPLFGLKTLLAIGCAWLVRANILAAVVAVTLHDIALPLMPLLLRMEYQMGYWLLSSPHQFPPTMHIHDLKAHEWMKWTTFVTVGVPLLLGSVIFSLPISILTFILSRNIITNYRKRHPHKEEDTDPGSVA